MFDWPSLLRARGVEFVTRGPNVRRGQIAVKCPWCGESDPSQHLGISRKGSGWGCWRNAAHRGRSRSRLIEALLRCSREEAQQLAGEGDFSNTPTDEDLISAVAQNLGAESVARPVVLSYPSEFKRMSGNSSGSEAYWEYLYQRGYSYSEAAYVVDQYEMRYCRVGVWGGRLIVPVCDRQQRLLTWTGRTINPVTVPRYKSLSKELSLSPASDCILGLPVLWSASNPRLLVVCEGPFDALRLTALGHDLGVYGTCLFGLNVSEKQTFLLSELSRRFDRVGLSLDKDAEMSTLRLQDKLRVVGVSTLKSLEVKDPGELDSRSGRGAIQSWLS